MSGKRVVRVTSQSTLEKLLDSKMYSNSCCSESEACSRFREKSLSRWNLNQSNQSSKLSRIPSRINNLHTISPFGVIMYIYIYIGYDSGMIQWQAMDGHTRIPLKQWWFNGVSWLFHPAFCTALLGFTLLWCDLQFTQQAILGHPLRRIAGEVNEIRDFPSAKFNYPLVN